MITHRQQTACSHLLVLALTAGCAVGPRYQRPAAETPAAWKSAPTEELAWKTAAPGDAIPRGEWWRVFGQAELNELQHRVLERNQDVKAAVARVMEARALARQATADWSPTLDATPSYSHFQRTRSGFGGTGTFRGDTYNVPFDLSYEVDLWGRVRRGVEATGAEAEAKEAAYHTVLLTLTAETARTYVLIRTLDAETEIVGRAIALRRETLDLVTKRWQAGVVNELDVARAKTELATAESDAVDLRRRRAELEHALAVLCGEPAPTFSLPVRPLAVEPRGAESPLEAHGPGWSSTAGTELPQVPAGLPSALLERRPDVAEAERGMAAANARVGVAQAAFFPVITLTGSGGFESAELDMLFERDSRTWSLGPSISIPLFAGGRNTANLRAARARYDQAVAGYRQQVLVAFREVEDALSNLRLRSEQAAAHQRVLEGARQAAKLSSTRYTQGLVNYLEVVDAERLRLQAEREAVNILGQRLVSTVLLVKALGGEWAHAQ